MKQLLLMLCLAFSSSCFAEKKIHFGIRTCINISDISSTKIKDRPYYYRDETTQSKIGGAIGLFVEVPLFKYASIQTEANYSGAGFKHSYHEFGAQNATYSLNYLSVPVILKARIVGIALYSGLQYSSLQKAKEDRPGFTSRGDIRSDHQPIEWAFIYGLEYTSPFGLGVNFRYQVGLSNIAVHNSQTYQIDDNIYNRVFQFGLYYRFLK